MSLVITKKCLIFYFDRSFPISNKNISTRTQSATPNDRPNTITGNTLNERQFSITPMVRHNFHTMNHREVNIHLKWFIPYPIKTNILQVKVIYHARKILLLLVNDHTWISAVVNINILNNYPWKEWTARMSSSSFSTSSTSSSPSSTSSRETEAVPSEAVVNPKKESAEIRREILRSHKGSERSLERVA